MVDVKISGLPNAAALTGNEAIPAVQGGSSVKVLVSAIRKGLLDVGGMDAPAQNQSLYFSGEAWLPYSLTAGGRALSGVAGTANTFPYFSAANVVTLGAVGTTGLASLAAANAAAGRTAIGAADDANVVHRTGAESVDGSKTWNAPHIWNISATAQIEYSTPGGGTGIVLRTGNIAGGLASRSDVRGNAGFASIGAGASGSGAGPTNLLEIPTNSIRPSATNVMSCGESGRVWTQVFATNPTISTSDSRLKTDPRQLRDAEFKSASAIARLPAVWRWLNRVHGDENCEPEGQEARKHFGPTVQAAIAVMEGLGLDPFAYSFICYDKWEAEPEQWHEWPAKEAVYETIPAVLDGEGEVVEPERTVLVEPAVEAGRELIQPAREAGDRYSFRKEELLCFIVRALAQEIDGLSERVAALEAGK